MTTKMRSRSATVPLALLGGAIVAAGIGVAVETPAQSAYMSVDEVKPGMKGYGLTVFSGHEPTKFGVEIISTLNNFQPNQDLFIIHTEHPRLEVAHTVAGMSGSPIYIDGKMIGAYAYGWLFGVEPVAGVTPISNMLEDLRRPVPKELIPGLKKSILPNPKTPGGAQAAKLGALRQRFNERLPRTTSHRFQNEESATGYDLRDHAAQVASHASPALQAPGGMGLRAASTDVMAGGLSPRALALATELLEPSGMNVLQAGGGGQTKPELMAQAPKTYADGGAVTVQLVRGDVSMSGLGTVTHVVGDKLVAFGHPMINGGIEALPVALGHVHWIMATANRSFKIGEPTRPLGTLVNDRQASIVIDTTITAPVFPVRVKVNGVPGAPKTNWKMEVSHDPFFAPSFVAVGMGSALETTAAERNDKTWRAKSKVTVAGYGTMEFEDFGAGNRSPVGAGDMARSRMVGAIGAVLNNPWEVGRITGVEMEIDITPKRDVMYLKGVQVLDTELDPGEPARIRLTFQPWLGEDEYQTIEVPIERSMAGKSVSIRLAPGYAMQRIAAPPESLGDLVEVLPKLTYPGQTLIASYSVEGNDVAYKGQVARELPPYAQALLTPSTDTQGPSMRSSMRHHQMPMKRFVIGGSSVTVNVRKAVK
ncbi:MAG: SpoIVB peptidase S55 domain-containing protein [Myxococcota bacterium]